MPGKLLLRFDDICPTMNWRVWDRIEKTLERYRVKPILAVVPDNRDRKLVVDAPRADFWDKVREWKRRGWAIGWHGYQHLYSSRDAGIVGLNDRSEFAGLPEAEQRRKLSAAARIFEEECVQPDLWIAPAHSFDACTVRILQEYDVRVISDGYFTRPLMAYGSVWVPQQLWTLRKLPFGTWTVCYHVNSWDEGKCAAFERDVARLARYITSLANVLEREIPERSMFDRMFDSLYRRILIAKRRLVKGRH